MTHLKFRGKRVDNGEWVYGYYYQLGSSHCIRIDIHSWGVIPETVGQFTGLYDRTGAEIYSNSILGASGNLHTDIVQPPFIKVGYENGSYNIGKESDTDYVVMKVTDAENECVWLEYKDQKFHVAPWEYSEYLLELTEPPEEDYDLPMDWEPDLNRESAEEKRDKQIEQLKLK